MLSVDANILLYAYETSCPEHDRALSFILSLAQREDVAISEFVLVELYNLLRNEAVVQEPLSAPDAVDVIQTYRRHPRWRLISFPPPQAGSAEALWRIAASRAFARRRIFDARTALVLRHYGVTDFATCNIKDFADLGFKRVWNPLHGQVH